MEPEASTKLFQTTRIQPQVLVFLKIYDYAQDSLKIVGSYMAPAHIEIYDFLEYFKNEAGI